MFRNLLVCALATLSGCVLYVEPYETRSGADSRLDTELIDGDFYISCDYDYEWDESNWYVEANLGYPYGLYDEEIRVEFYVDGWYRWWMDYAAGGLWTRHFMSTYYHCYEGHEFEFVITDDYGGSETVYVYW